METVKIDEVAFKENLVRVIKKYTKTGGPGDFITDQVINNLVYGNIQAPPFIRAFTHSSAGKINYEELEFVGDGVLNAALKEYIQLNAPKHGITFDKYTPIYNSQSANVTLSKYSEMLGFDKFIIHSKNIRVGDSVFSDVFEAFLGALNFRSMLVTSGRNSIVINRFVNNLLEDYQAQTQISIWESVKKDDVSFLDQVLRIPGKSIVFNTQVLPNNKAQVTVEITEEGKRVIDAYGTQNARQLPQKIATAVGVNNDLAKKEAASKARKVLEDNGIDQNWSDAIALRKTSETFGKDKRYLEILRSVNNSNRNSTPYLFLNINDPNKWVATIDGSEKGFELTAVRNENGKYISDTIFITTIKVTPDMNKKKQEAEVLKRAHEYFFASRMKFTFGKKN